MSPAEAKAAGQMAKLRRLAEDDGPCAVVVATMREKAEALAAVMRAVHGGEWRVDIELDALFVMIRQV